MRKNYKTLILKEIKADLKIKNPNKNLSKLSCGYQQTDSKIYMERQKIKNIQHNIKGE